jgi:hypothetical protein
MVDYFKKAHFFNFDEKDRRGGGQIRHSELFNAKQDNFDVRIKQHCNKHDTGSNLKF